MDEDKIADHAHLLPTSLARAVLFITVAALVGKFEFELYNTTDDDILLKYDLFLPRPKNLDTLGLQVTVKD
jgi:hypothetical protein